MSSARERVIENATAITSLLVLTALFIAVFFGSGTAIPVIAVFGFAVLVPFVAILTSDDEEETDKPRPEYDSQRRTQHSDGHERSTTDALATLRERYARGDLTDEQFERKLDALLETESPETAAEWRTREHDPDRDDQRDSGSQGRVREHERS